MVDKQSLENWCLTGTLPEQAELYAAITDETKRFTDVEGQLWDFKELWPFSYSDGYFGGICRLICAFSNSSGGLIIFGVNDVTRQGGKNSVRPNSDKLLLSFEQLTGRKFLFDLKSYPGLNGFGPTDVLLVRPRPRSSPPIVFLKPISTYREKIIWVRSASEVVRAEPTHFANLFFPHPSDTKNDAIDGSIPPSTSQIKKFIGRAEAMSELFNWLQNSDEPRTYLYGKGGSGKTAIAREFAKLVKAFGGNIEIEQENRIDIVLFLSAKEKELATSVAKVVDLDTSDFFDEESLLRKIISLSGGDPDLDSAVPAELQTYRKIVEGYLNNFSYLIVIDDIDTLTTKGLDPGADFLYRTLSRAGKRSKVLYTTRNAPSQSIHNSIEVPGLFGEDYDQFVDECISRFKTASPSRDFRDTRLPRISERRPLVIESIIALSRTAGSFDGAERLFLQNVGDDIREYVYGREWDALPEGIERALLAALADLNRPASFLDLKIILQAGDSTIRDAIGGVREMFLVVDDAGSETLFSIAPLTRSFVSTRKNSLKLYPAIKERVSNFKKTIKITSPDVARVLTQIRRAVPLKFKFHTDQNRKFALELVRDTTLSAKITEDPVFRAARGYVEAIQDKPNLALVRESFTYSIQMRCEPEIEELMAWFVAEKGSQSMEKYLYAITDVVISGRRYSEEDKIGMISRKATTAYNFAKQELYVDAEQALKGFRQSLLLHLRAFKLNAIAGSPMLETSERYARNTADQWFRAVSEIGNWEVLTAFVNLDADCDGYLDPVSEPLLSVLRRLSASALASSERARILAEAKRAHSYSFDRKKWMDTTILPRVLVALQQVIDSSKIR